jgi:hypothetical protein
MNFLSEIFVFAYWYVNWRLFFFGDEGMGGCSPLVTLDILVLSLVYAGYIDYVDLWNVEYGCSITKINVFYGIENTFCTVYLLRVPELLFCPGRMVILSNVP